MHLNLMTGALEGDDRIVEFVEAPGVTEGAMLHDALEAFNHGGINPSGTSPKREHTKV